ncbi:hypothetical protein RRG08_037819 [Elysia crispata]|uniref:Uncharacterized protein n=1 Tax=Elysia crispata TaxID=231223 RepID=A0AAE0YUG6_9GAST|nr:hypothetical protein RRG08_037819 [Elysia crispata]
MNHMSKKNGGRGDRIINTCSDLGMFVSTLFRLRYRWILWSTHLQQHQTRSQSFYHKNGGPTRQQLDRDRVCLYISSCDGH